VTRAPGQACPRPDEARGQQHKEGCDTGARHESSTEQSHSTSLTKPDNPALNPFGKRSSTGPLRPGMAKTLPSSILAIKQLILEFQSGRAGRDRSSRCLISGETNWL
jgi:hypothetical protein